MLNANDALKYTPQQILEHYHGTGHLPLNRPIYNKVVKEQFLQLKEMEAFALNLGDNEQAEMWRKAAAVVEPYIRGLNKYDSVGAR